MQRRICWPLCGSYVDMLLLAPFNKSFSVQLQGEQLADSIQMWSPLEYGSVLELRSCASQETLSTKTEHGRRKRALPFMTNEKLLWGNLCSGIHWFVQGHWLSTRGNCAPPKCHLETFGRYFPLSQVVDMLLVCSRKGQVS